MDSSSVYKSLCFAGVASSFAAAATHPIDTLKVKVQLTGNGRTSATQVLKNIVKCHQLSSLFWGLEAALLRSVTYGSVRYAIYSPIKKILDGEKETSSNQNGSSFGVKVLSGSISGCLASGVCNPTDLIKVRMQSGTHEGYSTVSSAIRKIVSEQGLRGLWVGSGPTCMRATVLAAAELSTYDQGKETILKSGLVEDGPIVHFSASLFAGFVSAAVTNPFDFAKSRIMSQQIDIYGRGTLYRSTFDCMLKSVRHEGFPVLWSGFVATFTRLGPNIIITFTVMEQLRNYFDPVSKPQPKKLAV